ncbi:hypothetical protein BAUCODRAFT_123930 [Baudoinia panamericana UAMH 10762]|uniref:Uncharacterized protein n=1 Tax=Baudoinia panamericana (strain UAMH 10762) TaxID=717646 RepID=M2N9N0_BAUPA|nr:uncharacterized protein BAUCODRAFT_123930 [Baudoinia panamericana UAMH 10762]EMC95500.1 hypothetical protein BAUCODRAFT_123930 [Baudoinia panamericana UAMH 10762]
MHRVIPQLHKKYGNIVRTGPDEVSISDVEAIRAIYGPGSKYAKSDWYSVWQGTQPTDLFAERHIPTHAALKRNISRVYTMSSMTGMEKFVDNVISLFIKRMHENANTVIDLGNWLQLLAFDVIGEVSFSRSFGFVEAGKDDGMLNRIDRALASLAWVGQLPGIYWLDHYLKPFIGTHLDASLRHGTIRSYAEAEVKSRQGRDSDRSDILGHLFKVSADDPSALDENAITSVATANVFAGSDTTAITLRAIVYFLLQHPTCLQRLRSEMQQKKEDGSLSFPAPYSQLSAWPYLQACISEALRLYPAVGMALPRVVPEGGAELAGHYLPGGTIVGMNAWAVHRNSQIYGADVDWYRPERWLDASRKGNMERCFLAFGGGARLCIGKNISLMEISKVIPILFDKFDMELVTPGKPLKETCAWFVRQEGLIVRLRPRKYA